MPDFAALETRMTTVAMEKLANATAVVGGVPTTGIFDNAYAEALGMGGTRPAYASAAAAVANAAIEAEVFVTCDSLGLIAAKYVVTDKHPEHGITRLFLERAA